VVGWVTTRCLTKPTMTAMKTEAMLDGFDKFSIRIRKRYDEVRDCLAAGRFEEAHELLASIALTHARTSMSLRNLLVKDGLLKGEK
jgi:hypothetical protein